MFNLFIKTMKTNGSVVVAEQQQVLFLYKIILMLTLFLTFSLIMHVKVYQSNSTNYLKISTLENTVETLTQERDTLKNSVLAFENLKASVKKVIANANKKLTDDVASKIALLEIASADVFKIDLEIGLAISKQESSFSPKIISYNGTSHGVKQINYSAHKKNLSLPSVSVLYLPEFNIPNGYRILEQNNARKNINLALQRYYGATDPELNRSYAQQVLTKARNIKKQIS